MAVICRAYQVGSCSSGRYKHVAASSANVACRLRTQPSARACCRSATSTAVLPRTQALGLAQAA